METNFKNMPQRYYDNLKKMGTSEELGYGEFKEQGLPKKGSSGSGGTSDLPAWTKNYPCLSDRGKIEKTQSETQVYYNGTPDAEFSYYFNKDLTVLLYDKDDVKKFTGTWNCVNGKLLIKTPSDNQQWTKDKDWHDIPKVSKFKKCSEELPIKQWCKNETIKKVQACLGMPKRFLTGNFGENTQEYLESRKQDGKVITTQTIINVCGSNDPLITGSSGNSGTSGTSGTGASGTSGAGTSGTSGQIKAKYDKYRKVRIPEE